MSPSTRDSFACPCCGGEMDTVARACACGARLVGDPILEPVAPKPMFGSAVVSAVCATLSVTAIWYRPSVALATIAIAAGLRALRSARSDPKRFGGRRTASAGFALGCAAVVGFGGLWLAGIPRAIERQRERQAALTRAEMYRVSARMIAYRARFGAYPSRVSDLEKLEDHSLTVLGRDGWAHPIDYAAFTGGVASRRGKPILNANFELRSPGPDGVTNTTDDIVMRDGLIVEPGSDSVAPVGQLPVTVPVSNRLR